MRRLLLGLAFVVAATTTASAGKKQVKYIGVHPIAKAEGGGMCYIEGPHVHVFAADKVQYRDHRGHKAFVGDPVAYGYDGPRHSYKGHHPVHVHAVVGTDEPDVEYCYLDGPHYHHFAAPEGPEFQVRGDAYFYVGEPPRAYIEARPAMIEINAMYRPIVYTRPVITVDAPVGWIGARAEFITPVIVAPAPRVHVVPPRAGVTVDVHIPTPSLHIDVGIGGVIRGGHRHHHRHHGHGKFKHKKFKRGRR